MTRPIPAAVLGATGYVGGELLRLLAAHPAFDLLAAVSTSRAGDTLDAVFPALGPSYPGVCFITADDLRERLDDVDELALFSAAPHGASAKLVAELLAAADSADVTVHCVDSSADFRFADADTWQSIYGDDHGAPSLLPRFSQGLPEFAPAHSSPHIGHPGCFATAAMLAAVPLAAAHPETSDLYLLGITGSTGSGRQPGPGTHHPERHSNLYAYKPLAHRHAPEIAQAIAAAAHTSPAVHFVPHSGPFARGIHMTLQAALPAATSADDLRQQFADFYRDCPFVTVVDGTPRLKDVVGSNHCRIGVATSGRQAVVLCVIDNLVKGAAGGAVQWMNRLWSLPETAGLDAVAPAWT